MSPRKVSLLSRQHVSRQYVSGQHALPHSRQKGFRINPRKNAGFLIPLAAILIVGIGVLAIAISRFSSQSSTASVVEGISVQAFYAAESGAYYGLNQVMFNVNDRTIADANCDALTGTTLNYTAQGLRNCQATVVCGRNSVAGNPRSFYIITSNGSCGGGDIFAQRIVEVSSVL